MDVIEYGKNYENMQLKMIFYYGCLFSVYICKYVRQFFKPNILLILNFYIKKS